MSDIIKVNLFENGCFLIDVDKIGSKSLPIYYNLAELIVCSDEIYILQENKITVGFVIFEKKKENKIHIKSIAIDPEHRRNGYATKLLEFLKNNYKDITLYVQKGNFAIDLYKKNEFKIIQVNENYYTTLEEKCAFEMRYQKL